MSPQEKRLLEIWVKVIQELDRAEEKHPSWPDDVIHGAAIVCEEAGEVIKAAFDLTYSVATEEQLEKELVQTAAMAVRMLLHLTKPNGEDHEYRDHHKDAGCPTSLPE